MAYMLKYHMEDDYGRSIMDDLQVQRTAPIIRPSDPPLRPKSTNDDKHWKRSQKLRKSRSFTECLAGPLISNTNDLITHRNNSRATELHANMASQLISETDDNREHFQAFTVAGRTKASSLERTSICMDLFSPQQLCTTEQRNNDIHKHIDATKCTLMDVQTKLQAVESHRKGIQEDLEVYLQHLTLKKDESGQQLIEFPANYNRIVSLMTEKDLIFENMNADKAGSDGRQWSHVLLRNALAKQNAFGCITNDEEDDGLVGMQAKVALKIAQIRQLDVILESKLGKDLYRDVKRTKKSHYSREHSKADCVSSQCMKVVATSNAKHADKVQHHAVFKRLSSQTDYIERNRQLVQNLSTKFTRAEEDRLDYLLEGIVEDKESAGDLQNNEPRNVYELGVEEKEIIDRLIEAKMGTYQPILLTDRPQEEYDSIYEPEGCHLKAGDYIQAGRRERLTQQRLGQIEQDLRLLEDIESSVIILESENELEAFSCDHISSDNCGIFIDDCASLKSFQTMGPISTTSTCRSVISRHDFHEYIRSEIEQVDQSAMHLASREEVSKLLETINQTRRTSLK